MANIFIQLLLCFILLALAAPASLKAAELENETARASLRIGCSHVLGVLPLLAQERHLFAKHGIAVKLERIDVGKLAMDAVLSGSVDVGCVVDPNLAVNSFHPSPLRAFVTILSDYDNGIAFRAGPGITHFSHLKGKRIGYLPATTSHALLLHLLEQENWSMNDIQAVVLQAPAMLPSLRAGNVDAVSIWNPWRYTILRSLSPQVQEIENTAETYRPMAYLAATETTLKEKSATLQLLLSALQEAESYAQAHWSQVKPRFAAWNNMDQESLDSVWPKIQPRLDLHNDAIQAVTEDIRLIRKHDKRYTARETRRAADIFSTQILRTFMPQRIGTDLR
jgi:NitT/TauT family transport system substrate-binding protein